MQSSGHSSVSPLQVKSYQAVLPSSSTSAPSGFSLAPSPMDAHASAQPLHHLQDLIGGDRLLPLPTTPRSYLLYLCGLLLLVGALAIQVLMSAQTLQARAQLETLRQEYALIQQGNSELIWQIARETNLERVQRRLAGKGYVPVTVEYIVMGGATPIAGSAPSLVPRTTAASNIESTSMTDTSTASSAPNAPGHAIATPPTIDAGRETWFDALAQGVSRWEALFVAGSLERPGAPRRFDSSHVQGAIGLEPRAQHATDIQTSAQTDVPAWWERTQQWAVNLLPSLGDISLGDLSLGDLSGEWLQLPVLGD